MEKVVISNYLPLDEPAPGDNTRIIKRVDAPREIAAPIQACLVVPPIIAMNKRTPTELTRIMAVRLGVHQ